MALAGDEHLAATRNSSPNPGHVHQCKAGQIQGNPISNEASAPVAKLMSNPLDGKWRRLALDAGLTRPGGAAGWSATAAFNWHSRLLAQVVVVMSCLMARLQEP
jgi:hypothetical protein